MPPSIPASISQTSVPCHKHPYLLYHPPLGLTLPSVVSKSPLLRPVWRLGSYQVRWASVSSSPGTPPRVVVGSPSAQWSFLKSPKCLYWTPWSARDSVGVSWVLFFLSQSLHKSTAQLLWQCPMSGPSGTYVVNFLGMFLGLCTMDQTHWCASTESHPTQALPYSSRDRLTSRFRPYPTLKSTGRLSSISFAGQ